MGRIESRADIAKVAIPSNMLNALGVQEFRHFVNGAATPVILASQLLCWTRLGDPLHLCKLF